MNLKDFEIISVHYKTPDYIYEQYKSVRELYQDVSYRIIDGSDNGEIYFKDLEENDRHFKVERLGYNIHHGPGMDFGIKSSKAKFLLILDSDVTLINDLLTPMSDQFRGYAVGRNRMVNAWGVQKWEIKWMGKLLPNSYKYPYLQPLCLLISRDAYLQFKPFFRHGSPCIDAMIDIYKKDKTSLLVDFPIENYVKIKYQGTAKSWGMNIPKWSYLKPRF